MENVSVIAQFKKKNGAHSYGTIFIRAWYHRKPVTSISTGYKIKPQHWNMIEQRVHDNAPNAQIINTLIDKKLNEIKAKLMQVEIMGTTLNITRIRTVIKGKNGSRDFLVFCREKINANYNNIGTKKSYLSECTKMEAFTNQVRFADIDYGFLERYHNHMRDQLHNVPNTIWKTFKWMNTMINLAIKHGGIISENPFKEFNRGNYKQSQRTWLEMDEVQRIFEVANRKDIPDILKRVAIYFLLMCYTGLRFEDAISFDPLIHIIEDERIVRRTSKGVGNVINIKIYAKLLPVVELVKAYPLQLSNQKFNVWLKQLAITAGIDKNLTTHVGRHTFGGFMPDANIPKDIAQRMLGHTDKKSTEIYYHLKDRKIDEAADRLNYL